ncbi:MAG: four helix bundle protein [Hydrogenophilaceae bacterium]|nr:four helix bundle protein [Hydrogenophilaceae bacterium]
MGTVKRFEDLIAWQKARVLTREIYALVSGDSLGRDYGLKDQLQRVAVSIMANIAEGFERGTDAEFHRFLTIARGSCAEVRSHLYVALDVGHIEQVRFTELMLLAEETARVLGGLKTSVSRRKTGN